MLKNFVLGTFAAATLLTGAASAQEAEGRALAQCLVDNSTADVEATMKTFFIAALTEDRDTAVTSIVKVAELIEALAQNTCGIPELELYGDVFNIGAEMYSQYIGEKIMSEAIAKIGM